MIKLIVAGGRDYVMTPQDHERLAAIHRLIGISELVEGGQTGADIAGMHWAEANGIPTRRFDANWEKYGRAAGPIRNGEMAHYADAVALFPGGRGTESMRHEALRAGIRIFDFTKELAQLIDIPK